MLLKILRGKDKLCNHDKVTLNVFKEDPTSKASTTRHPKREEKGTREICN